MFTNTFQSSNQIPTQPGYYNSYQNPYYSILTSQNTSCYQRSQIPFPSRSRNVFSQNYQQSYFSQNQTYFQNNCSYLPTQNTFITEKRTTITRERRYSLDTTQSNTASTDTITDKEEDKDNIFSSVSNIKEYVPSNQTSYTRNNNYLPKPLFSFNENALLNEKKNLNSNSNSNLNSKEISVKKKNKIAKASDNEINPEFENTVVLSVNVKLPNKNEATFQIKRYDDIFETIKLFCEINSVEERLMKPLIIKSLCTLNTIYQVYNSPLDQEKIKILQKIQNQMDN